MKLVLDANAALEIALAGAAQKNFETRLKQADEILVPELFLAEVANALWQAHKINGRDWDDCQRALDIATSLPNTVVAQQPLLFDVFHLSKQLNTRAAYDMFYLALARREGASLLTLDGPLKKEAKRAGVRLV